MTFSSDFDPNTIIRTATRLPERPKLSSAEIKRRAETYLIQPPSAELLKAYRFTATGGVVGLMHYQSLIGIAPRTVRKYVELGVLERLPDRTPNLRKLGLAHTSAELRLYTLGPVGHAMAELESIIAPSGYHALVDRVTHDFLATYVVVRFLVAVRAWGLQWEWRNRYQCALKFEYKDGGLEPDAAVRLYSPQTKRYYLYLFEFHNEDHSGRAAEKLYQYHRVEAGRVRLTTGEPWWNIETPTLLVAAPHRAPVNGYHLAFTNPQNHGYKMQYTNPADLLPKYPAYGITLATHMKMDALVWGCLRTKVPFNVLTHKPV